MGTDHREQHQLQTDGLLHPRFARAACIFLPFHQGKGNSLSSGRRSNQRYRKFSVSNRRYSVKEYRIILDLTKCHQIKSKWHKREENNKIPPMVYLFKHVGPNIKDNILMSSSTKKSRSSTNNVLSGGTIFQNKKESVSRRWQIVQMQPTTQHKYNTYNRVKHKWSKML